MITEQNAKGLSKAQKELWEFFSEDSYRFVPPPLGTKPKTLDILVARGLLVKAQNGKQAYTYVDLDPLWLCNEKQADQKNCLMGWDWFAPRWRRFYRTKTSSWEVEPEKLRTLFVESSKFVQTPRRYSIRTISWITGRVHRFGSFEQFAKLGAAKKEVKRILLKGAEVTT